MTNEISFSVQQMHMRSAKRKPGYVERVLSLARREGGKLTLTQDQWHHIRKEFSFAPEAEVPRLVQTTGLQRTNTVKEPTAAELATNFASAMQKWAAAGFATVTPEVYAARAAVCEACEFWDGAARLGLGKCKHKQCGCTRFKRYLATEKCPLAKWPP